MSQNKPKENKATTPESARAPGEVSLSKLQPDDIFIYKGDRYKRGKMMGKTKVKVILLTQAQVGATATEKKTIEYGVSRLELPVDTQVLKSKPL